MLTGLFKAARQSWFWGRRRVSTLTASFADALCPEDKRADLDRCRREAADFRHAVLEMTARRSPELYELCDIFEIEDTFSSYSEMMGLFAMTAPNADDESLSGPEYHYTRYLGRTAENFLNAYRQLPAPVQSMLDRSLNMQITLLIGQLLNACNDMIEGPEPEI